MAITASVSALPGTHHRGWQIAWGVLLVAAGVLAILMPGVAALATALTLAWILVLAGVCEIAYAAQTRHRPGFVWKLASGIITLLLGLAIVVLPVVGVLSLALLVGAMLLAAGIARVLLGWKLRSNRGWGWVFFDGLLSIALALLIAVGWPATSIAVIGVLTGISLISTGIWRLMLRDDVHGDEAFGAVVRTADRS
jgi:uncharacterized membrane protein HdeD (DUF308 family)